MRAEDWNKQETELEGWAVKITSYRIGDSYLTEVEAKDSGATVARGIAESAEASRRKALQSATERLQRTRRINLTIGG
ncbi:MAG TPA: hypothetical protein VHZ55_31000 [Bryobacteraceae bacterium]|jgi:hypothetical protein|nr:hypothetical protein [Bryobacteraceae bacterium]